MLIFLEESENSGENSNKRNNNQNPNTFQNKVWAKSLQFAALEIKTATLKPDLSWW